MDERILKQPQETFHVDGVRCEIGASGANFKTDSTEQMTQRMKSPGRENIADIYTLDTQIAVLRTYARSIAARNLQVSDIAPMLDRVHEQIKKSAIGKKNDLLAKIYSTNPPMPPNETRNSL